MDCPEKVLTFLSQPVLNSIRTITFCICIFPWTKYPSDFDWLRTLAPTLAHPKFICLEKVAFVLVGKERKSAGEEAIRSLFRGLETSGRLSVQHGTSSLLSV